MNPVLLIGRVGGLALVLAALLACAVCGEGIAGGMARQIHAALAPSPLARHWRPAI